MIVCCVVFFFKQMTAYEQRISDWSSDVCSSDLSSTATPNGNIRTNIAAATLKGLDITGTLQIVRPSPQQLAFDLGATVLDSKITKFESANPVLVTLNLGHNLPAAPDASGHARLSHSITFGDAWRLKSSVDARSEEHTSELQSLMRISYAVFCLKKQT